MAPERIRIRDLHHRRLSGGKRIILFLFFLVVFVVARSAPGGVGDLLGLPGGVDAWSPLLPAPTPTRGLSAASRGHFPYRRRDTTGACDGALLAASTLAKEAKVASSRHPEKQQPHPRPQLQHPVWSRWLSNQDDGNNGKVGTSHSPTLVMSDEGREIELPDFAFLFERICQVSPLARQVMMTEHQQNRPSGGGGGGVKGGFDAISREAYQATPESPWKVVDGSPLLRIDRIDNFSVVAAGSTSSSSSSSSGSTNAPPLLRFRSTLEGPCLGECFASFIMDFTQRQKWDRQVDQVYEIYSVKENLGLVREIQKMELLELRQQQQQQQQQLRQNQSKGTDDKDLDHERDHLLDWGTCNRMGVGYCRTKPGFVSPREQLTLCGIQDWEDGSCLIWGVEMDRERHEPLLPPQSKGRKRPTRAKSNLFCTTLTPRRRPSPLPTAGSAQRGGQKQQSQLPLSPPLAFDVEYVLQLDIGGKIPPWVAGPVVTENVRQLFAVARSFFAGTDDGSGQGGGLERYLLEKAREVAALGERIGSSSSASASASVSNLRPLGACMEDRHSLLMTF
jgi:hypothetical protein